MYQPIEQTALPNFTIVVRPAGAPASMMPAVRATMRAADPTLPIYEIRTMEERVAATVSQTRGTMLLLIVTAILAAALSSVAIYGSVWDSAVQGPPRIGKRVPLAA